MLSKIIIFLSCFTISCFIMSCESTNSISRKDCQNGAGYDGYLKGYYTANNSLQRKPINLNNVYDYCYMQGYVDALG